MEWRSSVSIKTHFLFKTSIADLLKKKNIPLIAQFFYFNLFVLVLCLFLNDIYEISEHLMIL